MQIYLVGGAVRDQLLGLAVHEQDYVVVGETPENLLKLGYKPVGKDFPVFLHPETKDEYALARTERKTGRGYTEFHFYSSPDVTLEDDLKRRDLTINAMALTVDGKIVDPYNGQHDLQHKILRHVSPAFMEDPVRILRCARFYARFANLGFTIAPETISLMRAMVRNGEINYLVAERVWQECQRALTEAEPQRFFEALRLCDALKVLFPELNKLYGVPGAPKWHPEIDSGIHTLMVLQQAAKLSSDPATRFAALLHDLGKAETALHLWPKHPDHTESAIPVINNLCDRLKVPKHFRDLAIISAKYHGMVHDVFKLDDDAILKLIEHSDGFRRPERFAEFLLVCLADARGRPGYEIIDYPQRDFLLAALTACKNISAQELLTQGILAESLPEELKRLRVLTIADVRKKFA